MELIVKNLQKSYGKHQVLKGLSATLQEGIHGFLGANGVGKTTFFSILTSYITDYSGDVIFPHLKTQDEVLIGTLPQKFSGYPDMTVREFMEYMGKVKVKGISSERLQRDIDQKLKIFGLETMQNKKIRKLSGGQLRRLGIAQAFQLDPKVVLLDEPTTGLDPSERVKFKNYISEAGEQQIILLSTHIVSDLEHIAKDIYILKDGTFLAHGSEDELAEKSGCRVWNVAFDTESEIRKLLQQDSISMIYEEDGKNIARYISPEKPCPNAIPVKPNMNEIYLSYFATDRERQ
ncbi:MAG: ABC transporter ATP-binding protein [Chordicoccus sp.]